MIEKPKNILLSSWGGAVYIDRWMGVHFLAGVVLGFVFRIAHVELSTSIAVIFSVLVVWEVVEQIFKIYEPWQNTFLDIVVGMVGALIVFYCIPSFSLHTDFIVGGSLLVLYIVLSIFGWRAWRARNNTMI